MNKTASMKPEWKLNLYGQMELLVPSTQEYALAVVPIQTQGGLLVRLVASQSQFLESLDYLTELQSLSGIKDDVGKLIDSGETLNSLLTSTLAQLSHNLIPDITSTNQNITIANQKLIKIVESIASSITDIQSLGTLHQDLVSTNNALGVLHQDLVSANNALSVLHQDLVSANNALSVLHQDLVSTNNALGVLHQDLVSANNALSVLHQDLVAIAQKIDALSQSIAPPSSTIFANIAMPAAQTEYSYQLPAGTKAMTLRCNILQPVVANDPPRTMDIYYSFESGQVALAARGLNNADGSLPRCRKVLALNSEFKEVRYGNRTLYLACAQGGWVAEIDTEV
jgi:hypothetical protein